MILTKDFQSKKGKYVERTQTVTLLGGRASKKGRGKNISNDDVIPPTVTLSAPRLRDTVWNNMPVIPSGFTAGSGKLARHTRCQTGSQSKHTLWSSTSTETFLPQPSIK